MVVCRRARKPIHGRCVVRGSLRSSKPRGKEMGEQSHGLGRLHRTGRFGIGFPSTRGKFQRRFLRRSWFWNAIPSLENVFLKMLITEIFSSNKGPQTDVQESPEAYGEDQQDHHHSAVHEPA